jgi:exopolysaccharide biosynthesis polyprenyl glycosylphosphotransferase
MHPAESFKDEPSMIRKHSISFTLFALLIDIAGVIGGMLLTAWLRPVFNPLSFVAVIAERVQYPFFLYFLNPAIWAVAFLILNIYDGRRNLRVVDEFTSLTFGNLLAASMLAGILYLTARDVSRFLYISLAIFLYCYTLLWRLLRRILIPSSKQKSIQCRLLIVGHGQLGQEAEKRISQNGIENITVVGYVDDDPAKQGNPPDILGNLDQIKRIVEENDITDIIVALPRRAHQRLEQLMGSLRTVPVQIWMIPDYFQLTLLDARIEDFIGLPMLNMRASALDEYQLVIKRGLDLLLTIPIILIGLPAMGLIALAILIDDGRPIFFTQKRAGMNGKYFTMFKFRTMKAGAEKLQEQVNRIDDQGNLIHKQRNDPRVTRVGRFLRRFSLDELPQFFNVLIGNMSLVGPRPELPFLVEQYEPWQRKRFTVPQGLTGWWQIHGRSDKPMHLNTEADLYYIQNYTLWLDIQIILQTVWAILRGKGAY